MQPDLSPDDEELDRIWRERFGQPLPIRGARDVVLALLGLSESDLRRDRPADD